MSYPKTKEEWWELVDENWENLRKLISRFHPRKGKKFNDNFIITAPVPEKIRLQQVKEILKENFPVDILQYIEVLRSNRDTKLLRIVENTWWGLPESVEVRDFPGFGVLCDLCSEAYLLE